MVRELSLAQQQRGSTQPCSSGCEHRTVAPDGRIVCKKIAWGENKVSPSLCRTCPAQTVNCAHLRFSLRHSPPSSLLVRHSGRTEVWNDDRPALEFQQAACALQVMPLHSPRSCASCAMRQPASAAQVEPAARPLPADRGGARPAASPGKVVPFPEQEREPVAATG